MDEKKQKATKGNRSACLSIGQHNSHQCSSLHNPGQWIPHEAQKLEKLVFLHNRPEVKKLIREVQSRQSSRGVFPHKQGMWLLNWRKQRKSTTLDVIVERGSNIGASANNTLQLESLYHSLLSKCIGKQNTTKGEQNGHWPYHFLL